MNNLPIILIEVVLVFGGVLAFGWWQLRSVKRDRQKSQGQRKEACTEPGIRSRAANSDTPKGDRDTPVP
jgi:hypothetical protein